MKRSTSHRRMKRLSRRRSCEGGLLRLARCGAIISIPSWRNSSSSEDVMTSMHSGGHARGYCREAVSAVGILNTRTARTHHPIPRQSKCNAFILLGKGRQDQRQLPGMGLCLRPHKVSPVDVGPAHARRKDYKRAQSEHLFRNLPRPSSSAPCSNRAARAGGDGS